jgi:ribulose-phosphate 3-epimerase
MAPCGNRWGTLRKACYAQMESWSLAVPQHSLTPTPPPDVDAPCSAGLRRFSRLRAGGPAIIPSLLLCDFGHLAEEVARLEAAGVHGLHLDVMDGHFVPNLTYGLPIVQAVRRATELPIEAHLMISEPGRYAREFVEAGADTITFHVEAAQDPQVVIDDIHAAGAAAGLALNPATPLASVLPFLATAELLLVMSVHPGFGGQGFETVALDKLRQLSSAPGGADVVLEVDGGVNTTTIGGCAEAGAQLFVVGSAIFRSPDYAQSIASLTRSAQTSARTR